jgi:hypothetical protein
VLIGMSRTYSSGDAFFVVDDLYRGDDVESILCSSINDIETINSRHTKVSITRDGIVVRVLHQYNLMACPPATDTATDLSASSPLVSFVAKICTLISFTEIYKYRTRIDAPSIHDCLDGRASQFVIDSLKSDESKAPQSTDAKDADFSPEEIEYLILRLSTSPEDLCHRFLTITPIAPAGYL